MAIIPAEEKVFMVSNSTNTTYSGSAALKAMQQWYTMQDISDSVVVAAPYQVFTALLTQSGESRGGDKASGDTLTLGVTYLIYQNPYNEDLTIFGAPNSNVGTYFICTTVGVLPDGTGLSFDYGAPVATVLENTIGNLWFTYNDVGTYFVNSNGLFINDTWTNISLNIQGFGDNINFSMYKYDGNSIGIISGIPGDTQVDGILNQTCVEIRVYN